MIDTMRRIVTDSRVFGVTALAIFCCTLWGYTQPRVRAYDDIAGLSLWVDYTSSEVAKGAFYLRAEGRWLHEVLLPLLEHINGTVAVFMNLVLLFLFVFIAAKRYTSDSWYSLAFAALCVQSLPVASQLDWPVLTLPSFLLLLTAAAIVRMLGVIPFYLIFGMLFSGGIFHLYFMLPLLHLPLLSQAGAMANFKTLLTRIVPPWAGGVLFGWGIVLAIVYLVTLIDSGEGQIGLDIAEWRKVAGAETGAWGIIVFNALESFYHHIDAILTSNTWLIFAALGALAPGILIDRRHLPAKILFAGILLAPYIAVIPAGVDISIRSAVPTATGAAALLFLAPFSKGEWKGIWIRVTLLLFSVGWALQTMGDNLYRSAVTGIWMDSLVRVAPMDPKLYNGVVLLNATRSTIGAATRAIEEKLGLPHRNVVPHGTMWGSVALASGFRDAAMCGGEMHSTRPSLCEIAELLCEYKNEERAGGVEPYGLYDLMCVVQGNLVVAISRRFSSESAARQIGAAVEDKIGHSGLVARADFDVYLKGRKLYYVKDPCGRTDVREPFFLHIFPKDLGDLSGGRAQYGFDNLDHKGGGDAFVHGACVVVAELPDYRISRIVTGQYSPGRPRVWSVEFVIGDETQGNAGRDRRP